MRIAAAHPGTSELVGRAIQKAARQTDMPEGVFSLLFDAGHTTGINLVENPLIKAVAFTGSLAGGTALVRVAAARPEPIPVYAEMGSINPQFLLPEKLANDASAVAKGFVASMTLGAGQFCTNPGLVVAQAGAPLDVFLEAVSAEISAAQPQTMLTCGICQAFSSNVETLSNQPEVTTLAQSRQTADTNQGRPVIFATDGQSFINNEALATEVFGASSLVVKCSSEEEMLQVAEQLEGQLTASLFMADGDTDLASRLLRVLERKAGRIICNEFPTGVEVCHTMVHGGPFPASSDSRTTSVGSSAIYRFLRPVCYQDMPDELLPDSLKETNPLQLVRRVNGALSRN